ncbi:MAG: ABC transporter ATP-binding protein [Nitrospirae bacterium]|nr:ABC transporter ATP-binding protein [Nitrospirota bacterium]MBI5096342.1 ABC transporter ATP-binding protein [Nitrospirota bacterium]
MLRLENIHASYEQIEVLRGISLKVNEGEIVTIIGANGAGKTTTLMTISGLIKISKGGIFFEDRDLSNLPPHEIVRLGISQAPEGRRIFPRLTVLENLEMGAFLCKEKREIKNRLEMVYGYFPILAERSRQMGGTLSGGEQQMLAIGRALMCKPRLLLLDEPSLGLAPMVVSKIFEIIRKIRSQGVTVLLVEQNARAALMLADRGYVMETGTISMTNDAKALAADKRIREAYLGE